MNVGPIWTAAEGDIAYCVSPAVRKVLACSSREGDTVVGRLEERLAPEAVIARLINGTASSIRLSSFRIAWIIFFSSNAFCALLGAFDPPLRVDSSALAAEARRCPSVWISHRRDLVSDTADSSDVLPRAELMHYIRNAQQSHI